MRLSFIFFLEEYFHWIINYVFEVLFCQDSLDIVLLSFEPVTSDEKFSHCLTVPIISILTFSLDSVNIWIPYGSILPPVLPQGFVPVWYFL